MLLAKKKGMPSKDFVKCFGNKSRMSFALRGRTRPGQRGALLSYQELSEIAHKLKADPDESRMIILLGLLEYGPPELQSCVLKMYDDLEILADRVHSDVPKLNFSGKYRQ